MVSTNKHSALQLASRYISPIQPISMDNNIFGTVQGLYRLEKYSNLEGFLEKSLKIKSALKSTGKLLKSLEKSFNSTILCRTKQSRLIET